MEQVLVSKLEVVALTNKGLARRENEDAIYLDGQVIQSSLDTPIALHFRLEKPVWLAVADGMGGHASGGFASRCVLENLEALVPDEPVTESNISDLLKAINKDIFDQMRASPISAGMGSTIVGVCFSGEKTFIFNVGDSSAYKLQDGFLCKLSEDDSLEGDWHDQDLPRGRSGIITQCLGGAVTFSDIDPHIISSRNWVGSTYLICSDGLTSMLSIEKIEKIIQQDNLYQSVKNLFAAVMDAGAEDNVSIILARTE